MSRRSLPYHTRSGGAALLFVGALAIFPAVYIPLYLGSEREETVTVRHKERVVQSSGDTTSSRYVVFTDRGEFEVVDSWLYFDFRSSTRYGIMAVGATCRVTVVGWRAGFLSWYPNVVEVHDCEGAA